MERAIRLRPVPFSLDSMHPLYTIFRSFDLFCGIGYTEVSHFPFTRKGRKGGRNHGNGGKSRSEDRNGPKGRRATSLGDKKIVQSIRYGRNRVTLPRAKDCGCGEKDRTGLPSSRNAETAPRAAGSFLPARARMRARRRTNGKIQATLEIGITARASIRPS